MWGFFWIWRERKREDEKDFLNLLNIDGTKAVSFDMENENVKQVAETLKKKECIVTEKVSDECERYGMKSE